MRGIDLNTSLGRCASLAPAEEVAAQLGALADCVVLHPDDLEWFRETTRRFQFDLHIRKRQILLNLLTE